MPGIGLLRLKGSALGFRPRQFVKWTGDAGVTNLEAAAQWAPACGHGEVSDVKQFCCLLSRSVLIGSQVFRCPGIVSDEGLEKVSFLFSSCYSLSC